MGTSSGAYELKPFRFLLYV